MRGRPKKESTRDIIFKVRLNYEEDKCLEKVSKMMKESKSETVRKALAYYYFLVADQILSNNTPSCSVIFTKNFTYSKGD